MLLCLFILRYSILLSCLFYFITSYCKYLPTRCLCVSTVKVHSHSISCSRFNYRSWKESPVSAVCYALQEGTTFLNDIYYFQVDYFPISAHACEDGLVNPTAEFFLNDLIIRYLLYYQTMLHYSNFFYSH